MKLPFSNFFKQVFQKKATRPEKINKPVEQVKDEKQARVAIPKKGKCTRRPPIFNNRIESLNRRKRNIRNRIQKLSRIKNRSL